MRNAAPHMLGDQCPHFGSPMLAVAPPPPAERQHLIAQARSALLSLKPEPSPLAIEPWIVRSWQRCLANGHQPAQPLAFNMVSAPAVQRTADQHAALLQAARPVLAQLTRAIAGSTTSPC